MLDVNPDNVCFLIEKAREFQAKEAVVIPEEPFSPSDDWALQVLADHQDDLSYQEARAVIEDLEEGQQVEVVALMWLGRGDYEESEWEIVLEEAKAAWTPRTADYLLATPLVADYLREGLDLLGYGCD